MAEYNYSVSLRLWHPTILSAEITAALGIEPSRSMDVGAPRATPKGAPLEGVYDESFWTARLSDGKSINRSLSLAIGEALDDLASRQDFFREFVGDGGRAEFFIGWFFDDNSGDVFDHELLARLADFKIDLSFDVYPSTPD